jgi:cysteine desulfurase / selenocysteine lyase
MLCRMPNEWSDIRDDFPAIRRGVFLNAAGQSPTPRPVREAVTAFYRELEEGQEGWETWGQRYEDARARVAHLVNADPDEIAFVANTSSGINLVADLIGSDGPVLTDEIEFPALTLPWIHRGIPVHFTPVVEGVVRIESFEVQQAPRAATIAMSHVQFSNGCRQDLAAFGAIKGQRHLVVGGSQSVGAFPVDVRATRIDALACSGHKWLCAGYGAGFLFVDRKLIAKRPPASIGWLSVAEPFRFDNRRYELLPSARRVELGTPAFAGAFALGAAVRYLSGIGIEVIAQRVLELNTYLTTRLAREGFEVLSPSGPHRSGQTLCAVQQPQRAAAFLRENGIFITPKPDGVRISTHFYNSDDEIDACVRGLVEYRRMPAEE